MRHPVLHSLSPRSPTLIYTPGSHPPTHTSPHHTPTSNHTLYQVRCIHLTNFSYNSVAGCLTGGGNLTCTVVYETMLARAYCGKDRGGLVHIQLDNTCAECKCVVMLAFLCWLVHTGRYRRARLFFMEVGHTKTNLDRAGVWHSAFPTLTCSGSHTTSAFPVLVGGALIARLKNYCYYTISTMLIAMKRYLAEAGYPIKDIIELHHLCAPRPPCPTPVPCPATPYKPDTSTHTHILFPASQMELGHVSQGIYWQD